MTAAAKPTGHSRQARALARGLSQQFPGTSLALVTLGHKRSVPIFQQFTRGDPSDRLVDRRGPGLVGYRDAVSARARGRVLPALERAT